MAKRPSRDRHVYGSQLSEVVDNMVKFGDRKFALPEGVIQSIEELQVKFEVRLRPNDGTPVANIPEGDVVRHLLLKDRDTGQQFRINAERHNPKVRMPGTGEITLDLYEVFEGDKYKPLPKSSPGAPDFLNAVWRESWRRPPFQPYRDLIRRAVPFSLDDDATRVITALAMDPDKTPLYRQLARLPYDVVWLELNHVVQVEEQRRLGSNRAPHMPGEEGERAGYLIEKLGPTRWRAQYWALTLVTEENVETIRRQTASNGLQPGDLIPDAWPPLYVVDTEGDVKDYRTRTRDAFLRTAMQAVCDSDWGGAAGWGLGSANADGRGGWRFDLPRKMTGSATIDLPHDWEQGLIARHARPHERRDGLVEVLQATSKELAGTLRHLCAALATINEVPLSHKEHAPGASFRAGGMLRLFKVNRTVTINLPKAQATPKRILSLFRGAKRRMARHQVRGHWRRFRHKEDGAWVWERRWVEPFERGDAALGYVQHDYLVTT